MLLHPHDPSFEVHSLALLDRVPCLQWLPVVGLD